MANPYTVLGVEPGASAEAITKAYRRLARKLHPDLNPGDKAAEERFKDVANAYRLLNDADKRRRFDAGEIDESGAERPQQRYYRDYAGTQQADGYGNDDAYADFASGDDGFAELLRRARQARANQPGHDLRYRLPVSLADAINGAKRRLELPSGDTLDVTIPPGIVDGQTLRLKGKGEPGGSASAPAGDALIELQVLDDERFTRDGDDLTYELPVSLREAVLGERVRVPTPTGEVTMTLPPDSAGGTKLRLKGHGAPRRGGGRGDEFVRLKIVFPRGDAALREFVSTWDAGKAFNPREESAR